MNLSGVILAAGLSRRMGFPKALLDWHGETYLDRLIRIFSGVCSEVIVVARPEGVDALSACATLRTARLVINPDADRGQMSSLQCGLAAVSEPSVMFSPVDYAHVDAETVHAVASGVAPVVQPAYEGRHGHPVRIGPEVVAALRAEPAESQARTVLHRFQRLFIEVGDAGCVQDVDDPEAYIAIRSAQ